MSYTDWYFENTSDVITVDDDNGRVGIMNSNPAFTLDVNGDISGSNVISLNTIADYIEGSNAYIDNIETLNLSAKRVYASSNVTASNLISYSNLKLLNTWVSDECPILNQGSLFGFSLGGGFIDPSWIKTEDNFAEFLNSLWDLGQTGWDIAQFAQSVLDPASVLGDKMKDAINAALSNGSLRVPWRSINYKPIYGSIDNDIGIDGDVYMNETKAIYSLNSSLITTVNDGFNVNVISTYGAEKILDLNTKEAFLKRIYTSNVTASNVMTSNLTASNVIITSNLQVPDINANKIITGSVNAVDLVRCGDFYLMPSGLYKGNPVTNPFGSVQILDANGLYKGTIDRGQITNLEAFNIASAGNGSLIWGDFGNTTALNDPFALETPLFNV